MDDAIEVRVLEDEEDPEDVHYVEVRVSRKPGLAGPAGTKYVSCGCVIGKNYWEALRVGLDTEGCWAMSEVRSMLSLSTPPPGTRRYRR